MSYSVHGLITSALLTSTIPFIWVQSISIITATPEAANGVSTPPIWAQGVYHSTFIYIWQRERMCFLYNMYSITSQTIDASYGQLSYLWGRACRWWSHPCGRSQVHEDRAGRTLECPFLDTHHTRGPRLHPLSNNRHPHGVSLGQEHHSAHPHGSDSTAQYADLEDTDTFFTTIWYENIM